MAENPGEIVHPAPKAIAHTEYHVPLLQPINRTVLLTGPSYCNILIDMKQGETDRSRILDAKLERKLAGTGAVLVEGTKWCGKTTTCEEQASTAAGLKADDTERLQAILDSGRGRVEFPDGSFTVSRPLIISSDTHLVCSPRTVVRLADGSNCPILRNRGSEPGGSDRNITVEGGVWDGNNVGQKRGPCRLPKTAGGGDINQLTVFAGITNLTLRGMTLKDPDCYCIELTDIVGFIVEDIVFDCNDRTPNQDGLHIDGYARDGYIRNLRGHTNDDLVALNSDEGNWRSPSNDIENITIDGIYGGDDGYTAVRLLSRNARVNNIVIRNVYGRYKYNGVSFTHWADEDHVPGMGHFDNIVIENMFASSCLRDPEKWQRHPWGMVYFQSKVESVGHVTVRNLRRVDPPDVTNLTHTVTICEGAKIDTLILDNVEQSLPVDKPLIYKEPGVVIRRTLGVG